MTIPTMETNNTKKHVVSFSGGRTSAYLCYLMKKMHGDNVDFVYMDTGAEHPKTYEFIKKVNKEFDLNLTCLRAKVIPEFGIGVNYDVVDIEDCIQDLKPFKDIMEKYGTPTVFMPSCTKYMKTYPFDKYCIDTYGRGNHLTWLGIRIDEQSRLKGLPVDQMALFSEAETKTKERKIRYLAEISDFEKQDVLDWWAKMPFDLDLNEHLGNCVFCVKKGNNKIALAARDEPEMAKKFIDVIASDSVRIVETRTSPSELMYRNYHSLKSIIATYEDKSRDEIRKTIRYSRQEDAGSCSESCESFSDNIDLFDEEK